MDGAAAAAWKLLRIFMVIIAEFHEFFKFIKRMPKFNGNKHSVAFITVVSMDVALAARR